MKPSIERELEAIRQMVRSLEERLKNEAVELGHRRTFAVGRRGEVPAPTAQDDAEGRVLGTRGWVAQTGGSGSGGLSTVVVDNLTIGGNGSASSPLSASLLSGTIDARIKNLSGTIDGRFNSLAYLSAVSHDSTMTGDGTAGSPMSAAPTFVAAQLAISSSLRGILSASQAWTQTANGTEGTTLTAVIPLPFAGPQYMVFVTNYTGSNSPVYKVQNKTSASFQVVSTAPFANGEKLDLLAISGGLGPLADVSPLAVLSGTIDAKFVYISSSLGGMRRDVYEAADSGATWNLPAGAKMVEVICIGGGGGGGGGKLGAAGTERTGGGGGGGACVTRALYYAADLPSSVVITVATGGLGGTGGTSPTFGGQGGDSDFGGRQIAYGGGGGERGSTTTVGGGGGGGGAGAGSAGNAGTGNGGSPAVNTADAHALSYQGGGGGTSPPANTEWGGAGGGRGNSGNGNGSNGGGASLYGGAGGAGGGNLHPDNGAAGGYNGAKGGSSGTTDRLTLGGASAGVGPDLDGANGVAWGPYCGGGGGGGGAALTTRGGDGGDGYIGCGGGGGGASVTGRPVGNGGDGGDGRVIVITYF